MKKINLHEIILFYLIVVGVSAPFRLGLIHPEKMFQLPYGLNILYSVLRGIGPAIGFLVIVYLLKRDLKRTLSFWGTHRYFSLLAALIIPVGLTITGVSNLGGWNTHYYGLIFGVTMIFYALGEEYGWRGYLQEALAPMKTLNKILIIAILWYVWHLNFLNPEISLRTHVIHFLSLLLGAWGLLKVTETTLSILFAGAVHLSFNILTEVRDDFNKRIVILLVAIVVWFFLIRIIIRSKRKLHSEKKQFSRLKKMTLTSGLNNEQRFMQRLTDKIDTPICSSFLNLILVYWILLRAESTSQIPFYFSFLLARPEANPSWAFQ